MIEQVLLPLRIPIAEFGTKPERFGRGWGVPFRIDVGSESPHLFRGRTGKVVSAATAAGLATWAEIVKARIHDVEPGVSRGELHVAGGLRVLEERVKLLAAGAVLEVDRFGAAAKVESGLTESAFVLAARAEGFEVIRMPEDIARHLGAYYYYDFLLQKNGKQKRIEIKSLWGTNPNLARLIKSLSKTHLTSSCRFDAQDIFAVNLWLRTGRIIDFAYARSRARDGAHPYGLPVSSFSQDYVHQNPECRIGDGTWFENISDVWGFE